MQIRCIATSTPKVGANADSCEDAFAPTERVDATCSRFRCAVADGASTSAFARDWARILVRDFLARRPIAESQATWQATTAKADGPWWLSHKVAEGAFAAFCGLEFHEDGSWQATAWGDVCLFHMRGSQRLRSFPLESTEAFPSHPTLLCSLGDNSEPLTTSGSWQPDDLFVLASDAAARQIFDLSLGHWDWHTVSQNLMPTNDDTTHMHVRVT